METYATEGTGINLQKYEDSKFADDIDKAIAIASDHVKMDTPQVFEKVIPALQQLGQMMQQFKPQPQMTGSDIAFMQTSQAETQRRAAKDQQDAQLAQAKLQADTEEKMKDRETKVAMNAENNLTEERIKTAELTMDEVKLRDEQQKTALQLNRNAQQFLGE
jgi:hypothetical protein